MSTECLDKGKCELNVCQMNCCLNKCFKKGIMINFFSKHFRVFWESPKAVISKEFKTRVYSKQHRRVEKFRISWLPKYDEISKTC